MHCVQSNQTVHNKQTWTLLSDEKIVEEVIDLVEEMVRKTQQSCEDIAKEEETCCAICLEQIDYDDSCITKCKHKFCQKCIRQWLVKNNCCPFCRMDLSGDKIVFSEDKKLTGLLQKFIDFVNNLEYNIWKIKINNESDNDNDKNSSNSEKEKEKEGKANNEEEEEDDLEDYKECSICLEKIIRGKKLHCGHVNHLKCLK